MAKNGRPSIYSKELVDKLCLVIATSNKGLHAICKANPSFPAFSTVFNWLSDSDKVYFLDNYTRAREKQADFLADEIIEIADKCRVGKKTVKKSTGTETTTGDMVDRSRLQVDARKWKASKLYPKKYGDKIDVTSDNKPIQAITGLVIEQPKES